MSYNERDNLNKQLGTWTVKNDLLHGITLNHDLTADFGVFECRRIFWDPSTCKASLVRPFVRILCLPSPLHPPLRLLVRDDLRLPEAAQEGLVVSAETC